MRDRRTVPPVSERFFMYEEFNCDAGLVRIFDKSVGDENIRIMAVGDGHQSAAFTAPEKHFEIMYPYMFGFDSVVQSLPECKNVLLMGGGGFSYPKYFLSRYPDKNMDVVELFEGIYQLARKYFYLDEALEKFDADNTRLGVVFGDAYKYLKTCGKKYDIILNDAYIGNKAPRKMYSPRALKDVTNCLNAGGVYAVNVFCTDGSLEKKSKALKKALDKFFSETGIIYDKTNEVSKVVRNCVVTARDPVK